MSFGKNLTKKWINAKFDAKLVLSVDEKSNYINTSISLMNGKEFTTKDNIKGMSVQLSQTDLENIRDWAIGALKEHFSETQ